MLSPRHRAELKTALAHHTADRLAEAAPIYERIHAAAPNDFQINHLLGTLRYQQGRHGEAVALLSEARRRLPMSAPTHMCLGVALGGLGRHGEAEKALRMAVGLDPKSCDGWANLGAHYAVIGATDEAIESFERTLKIQPGYAHGWTGLGAVLHLAGRCEEAIACHTRALELEPGNRKARFGRGQALQALHRTDEALADFQAHLAVRPEHHQARSFRLFLLNYRDDLSRETLFAEHQAYGRAVENETRARGLAPSFAQTPDPGRRLRVAFLSPDLRSHSVAYFIEPLLRRLDPDQFEIFLYHDHFSVDDVSRRLRPCAAVWREFVGQGHDVVEQAIRADAPDLLVDLAGHTGFNRLELFARRLAPVQISYLGYPNTTGLAAMDYRLTDAIADPPGETDRFHTERLVRFAPTAWAYLPPADAPAPLPGPAERGEPVTFGSFNALSKASASTLRLWRDVLAATPGSRLLIKSSGMDAARWKSRVAEAGIALDRVELRSTTPGIPDHLACYAQVDVALDTFPYNGATTTCEALWMGVPVVTLAGDRHAARVGASLLTAAGHPEWIASSPEDYARIAANLAADRSRLASLRSGLRQDLRRSPLLDYPAQAERLGAALRSCWADWCAEREPAAALAATG
jgi:predicted O-linked N-acetylglucosamine transferase (SPINDLY family)